MKDGMKERGVTTITLKQINKEKVYQYIYRAKQTSKFQIVQELRMGLSTVSQNLNVLEEEGLIYRDGYFKSTGGRKAQIIQIVADVKISIGMGILKDRFYLVAINLYGEVIAKNTIELAYSDTEDYYEEVAKETEKFIEENHYEKDKILGVSIATQGIISTDGSGVTYGAIMKNAKMRLSDFSSKLSYPCRLVHDSKAAAYLELWNHPGLDSAVVFLLNPNLGGAVITNRKVHEGSFMHSGAIEHICIHPDADGPECYCGSHGCLETYCSANALEQSAGMSAKEFFETLRETKEERLVKIWKTYLKNLAFAMRNLNLIIDGPIIISGYLAPYFTEGDLNYLLKQINATIPFEFPKENLIVGTNGQYTPAVGAGLFYVKEFIDGLAPEI